MHSTRFFAILCGSILMAACLTTAWAADPLKAPKEFRGIPWGTPIKNVRGLTPVDRDGDIIHYDRAGERLRLGGIPLRHVTYSFYKGRFYHAEISYEKAEAFGALQASLEQKYGRPDAVREKTDPAGHPYVIAVWNWPGSVFIGHRHAKGSPLGRIFYFFDPLTDQSAKSQGLTPAKGKGATYTVKKGDTLSRLARQFDVTMDALRQANPGLTGTSLKAGSTITIPAPKAGASAATTAKAAKPAAPSGAYATYTVKPGDILSKIANAHGLRTRDVIAANPGVKPDRLRPGTALRIPLGKKASPQQVTPPTPAPAADSQTETPQPEAPKPAADTPSAPQANVTPAPSAQDAQQ